MPPIVWTILLLFWLIIVALALGHRLLYLLGIDTLHGDEKVLFAFGLGWGALQFVPFTLFALGIGKPIGMRLAALLLTLLLSRDVATIMRAGRARLRRLAHIALWKRVFFTLYTLMLAGFLVRAACPILASDGLTYHLPAAIRYLHTGSFVYLPTLTYTNWPLCTEMFFALLLGLHQNAPPALAQFVPGLIICMATYLLARRMAGALAGVVSLCLLLFINDLWNQIAAAMVDLTLTVFTTLAIYALYCVSTDREAAARRDMTKLAALFAGLATTAKLTGLWTLLCALLIYVLILRREKRSDILRAATVFFLTGFALLLPWLIKTWLLTGNPFYPILHSVFGGIEWTPEGWGRFQLAHLIYNTPPGLPPTPEVLHTVHRNIIAAGALIGVTLLLLTRRSPQYAIWAFVSLFFVCICAGNYLNARFLMPIVPAFLACLCVRMPQAEKRPALAGSVCLVGALLCVWCSTKRLAGWVPTLEEAIPVALGRTTREAFLHKRIPEYAFIQQVNRLLEPDTRLLVSGSNLVGLFRPEALWSIYNLQDSIHYNSQERLQSDLQRLHIAYVALFPYPKDCERNHNCRLVRNAAQQPLETLVQQRGVLVLEQNDARLYRLHLDNNTD